MARVGVIGAGMMGEAIVRGLLASGWDPEDVLMSDVRRVRLEALSSELGVGIADGNAELVKEAEGVLLAVKPQDAPGVLSALDAIGPAGLVSIVAGMRIGRIAEALGTEADIVRAMPNTPARVGRGITALAPSASASDRTRELAESLFAAVGDVVWVEEGQLDAVTALSGSGPAYLFLVAEALADAGVTLGLTRDVAETLAFRTIEGAGAMLNETGEHPAVLRGQVTSPGGTTAAGVAVLEAMALRAAVVEAVRAAHRRSVELG